MIFKFVFTVFSIALVTSQSTANSTASDENKYYKTSLITEVREIATEIIKYCDLYVRGSPAFITYNFSNYQFNPTRYFDTSQLISYDGYFEETHVVTTDDGYILTHFRITGGGKSPPKSGKPAVFLQHGLLASSDDYISIGKPHSLAYLLADSGYDVWIGNTRGNRYSQGHVSMTSNDPEYWSFSVHESGVYDLPATIDYILNATGNRKLLYVGHSQGTTVFFIMLAERPEYNDKIDIMVALAPAGYLSQSCSPVVRLLTRFSRIIYDTFSLFNAYYIHRDNFFIQLTQKICLSQHSILQGLCHMAAFLFFGYDENQTYWEMLPLMFSHFPDGIVLPQVIQWAQFYQAQKLQQRDYYTSSKNMEVYGQPEPPEYNLANIRAPMVFMYGEADKLADPLDVQRLYDNLSVKPKLYKVATQFFNHGDFLYGRNTPELVNNYILQIFSNVSSATVN